MGPRMGAPMGMMGREGSSSFFGELFGDNDPRSLDAEMFYSTLEELEESLHNLSSEMLIVVETTLLLRLWLSGHQKEVKEHCTFYSIPWSLEVARETLQRKSSVMDRTSLCTFRREAIVNLMEEGFGERMWSFRAVRS